MSNIVPFCKMGLTAAHREQAQAETAALNLELRTAKAGQGGVESFGEIISRFTKLHRAIHMACMDFENPIVWILGSLALIAIIVLFVVPRLTKEARLARRRRKSNARIVSKSQRPTFKFSVRTKNKK